VTRERLGETVATVLADIAPEADVGQLIPDASYHDQLGIDSIDFLRFMLALEKRLGIVIPELDYPRLSTPNGCESYLAGKLIS
jgi:acyl carrier protein